jgi:ABC-2 type transport system ATP-binding protein
MTEVLSCRGLRKRFGDLTAVDDVTFTISAGETYGLLGPNGAGKTTIISMVAGILRPDEGEVLVEGVPVSTRTTEPKGRIGYVPQELAIYPDLTGRENLRFFARLQGLSRTAVAQRVAHVLDVVGLADRADERAEHYSGGMKRRLHIGMGLLHEPILLVLDEPTAGVDPQSRNAIMDSIRELADSGLAILYTTHYMEEAERLCDRVGIIDGGRLVAEGTRRELVSRLAERDRISLSVDGDPTGAKHVAEGIPAVLGVAAHGDGLELLVHSARQCLPGVLSALAEKDVHIRAVEVDEPNLETVFLHLTGRALRE